MLSPFIIEQIRQREEENQARPQPRVELELPLEHGSPKGDSVPPESDRGVIVIDLLSDS